MNQAPSPIDLLREVAARLDALHVPYFVGGSFAASLHGDPRTSLDLDLVIELDPAGIKRFADAFEADFYVSREAMAEAIREHRSFNLIHLDSAWKLDFFVRGETAFDREEFRRRAPARLGEPPVDVMVKTAEDSVLRKLQWFRAGGEVAQLQWRDVVGILRNRAGSLDVEYLRHWSEPLRVTDLLDRALAEVGAGG